MATQKTSVLSFAALSALVLSSVVACSNDKGANKAQQGPAPEVSKSVTLEQSELGRKGSEVLARKYTITQGEVSVSDSLINSVFRSGTTILQVGNEEVTITDYCSSRSCSEVAAIVTTSTGDTKTADAYLFKTEGGKYVETCKQEDVVYSTALEAYEALLLACPAPTQDSPEQESPAQETPSQETPEQETPEQETQI